MNTRPRFSVLTRRCRITGKSEYLFQDHDKDVETFQPDKHITGRIIPTFMDGFMPIHNPEDAITVCDMLNRLHERGVAL